MANGFNAPYFVLNANGPPSFLICCNRFCCFVNAFCCNLSVGVEVVVGSLGDAAAADAADSEVILERTLWYGILVIDCVYDVGLNALV